jgi:hypothetical protein
MRLIARRFGFGSVAALAVVVATGVAMASLLALALGHPSLQAGGVRSRRRPACAARLTPSSRVVSYGVAFASPLVVWLGVKLTYG